ncbi:phosphoribosyl-ATP diphosphatase [Ancylobacter terrae]|uniref:phosphoribosyl-ATP diphosphatase n=1 Tax=Ancylobacter sp. sgz301288 TaxID=3342077 RepID=UPI00385D05D6
MADSIRRLHRAVAATQRGRNPSPRTEKLFAKGRPFIAKKLAEEGVEVALDAVVGDKAAVVRESADLLYNLVVLWVDAGIEPDEIWAEMERRERLMGMAEKLPKPARRRRDSRPFTLDLLADGPVEGLATETAPPQRGR